MLKQEDKTSLQDALDLSIKVLYKTFNITKLTQSTELYNTTMLLVSTCKQGVIINHGNWLIALGWCLDNVSLVKNKFVPVTIFDDHFLFW